jgi:hypothetical protein
MIRAKITVVAVGQFHVGGSKGLNSNTFKTKAMAEKWGQKNAGFRSPLRSNPGGRGVLCFCPGYFCHPVCNLLYRNVLYPPITPIPRTKFLFAQVAQVADKTSLGQCLVTCDVLMA